MEVDEILEPVSPTLRLEMLKQLSAQELYSACVASTLAQETCNALPQRFWTAKLTQAYPSNSDTQLITLLASVWSGFDFFKFTLDLLEGRRTLAPLPEATALQKQGYNAFLTYESDLMRQFCCICDPSFLAHNLEFLNYLNVDRDEGLAGLFILDSGMNPLATSVVDFECSSVCSRLEVDDPTQYAELSLLCSNHTLRRSGVASALLTLVKQLCKSLGKQHLVLVIANNERNERARAFYSRNGFIETSNASIVQADL